MFSEYHPVLLYLNSVRQLDYYSYFFNVPWIAGRVSGTRICRRIWFCIRLYGRQLKDRGREWSNGDKWNQLYGRCTICTSITHSVHVRLRVWLIYNGFAVITRLSALQRIHWTFTHSFFTLVPHWAFCWFCNFENAQLFLCTRVLKREIQFKFGDFNWK